MLKFRRHDIFEYSKVECSVDSNEYQERDDVSSSAGRGIFFSVVRNLFVITVNCASIDDLENKCDDGVC